MAHQHHRIINGFIVFVACLLGGGFLSDCNKERNSEKLSMRAYLQVTPDMCVRCIDLASRIVDKVQKRTSTHITVYSVAVVDRDVDCSVIKSNHFYGDTIICVSADWWSHQFPHIRGDASFVIVSRKDTIDFTLRESESAIDSTVGELAPRGYQPTNQ